MSRLRVAVIITRLEGGAGVLALRGARVMDPDRFQLTVITGSGDGLLGAARAAGLEVIVEPSLRAPIAPLSDIQAMRRIGSILRGRTFDVMHSHCAKAGAIGRLAARRAGIPRIVHTYHGFPFHEFQLPLRRSAYITAERRLGRITDVALCVGTGVAVEAVRRGLVPPERIRTIGVAVDGAAGAARADGPAGADGVSGAAVAIGAGAARGAGSAEGMARVPVRTEETCRQARALLGLPPSATVVGAVGRLTYQKAPEDFVAAISALGRPDVIGVWVGGGELAERVARLAAASPARVVLAGERGDVPKVLPAFDIFALPSRYEGLPTAVIEAMVCGVPVVATAVNAVGDVVVPGETGLLVPPQRPDLLAAAIRHLLASPGLAAKMAEAARSRLGGRYSEAALRGALEAAYASPAMRQACAGPEGPSPAMPAAGAWPPRR